MTSTASKSDRRIVARAAFGMLAFASITRAGPPTADERVEGLLARLTPDEKLGLISGAADGFSTKAVPRVGLRSFRMTDGPVGVRGSEPTTAYPASVLLAATWDPALAEREGASLARDARAAGADFLLGPGVNLYRVPQNGRNFEYSGEDPYLAGRMAVDYIHGVQGQGVAAVVKHFAANNQETGRDWVDVRVDERTLHELYLPAFEAAVKEGHVAAVMAAYNKVNGDWCTANRTLLTDVLRTQWGFGGVLMSDWEATHDTLGPAAAGLDLEMPDGRFFAPEKLRPLIEQGRIDQAAIDEKVRRLLRTAAAMGWLDGPAPTTRPADADAADRVALDVARAGVVLLKNDRAALPLDRRQVRTVVVLGPNADHYVAGGGSSRVKPLRPITVLDGLRAVAGPGVNVVPVPYPAALDKNRVAAMAAASVYDGDGLRAEFFNSDDLSGPPVATRTDTRVSADFGNHAPPLPGVSLPLFSVRWTGSITAPADGDYVFAIYSAAGSRIKLDGRTLTDSWSYHQGATRSAVVRLEAGRPHRLTVEYLKAWWDGSVHFGWGRPVDMLPDADRVKVAAADAAIVCVGTDDSERLDRPYALNPDQERLIRAVAAANPRTIVVLNGGGNVAMKDWIDGVPALLEAWYPGQAGGRAAAEILFGDVNPSGHLPMSFEADWPDAPAYGHYPGDGKTVDYAEGVYLGYRGMDKNGVTPRFAFGHGLSYTTFAVERLAVTPADAPGGTVRVTFDVTNTGERAGATVAQVYVRPPAGGVDRPVQELKGFARVDLRPGERRTVNVDLDDRAFAYWDVGRHDWVVRPGTYGVAVGLSSRDDRAIASVKR